MIWVENFVQDYNRNRFFFLSFIWSPLNRTCYEIPNFHMNFAKVYFELKKSSVIWTSSMWTLGVLLNVMSSVWTSRAPLDHFVNFQYLICESIYTFNRTFYELPIFLMNFANVSFKLNNSFVIWKSSIWRLCVFRNVMSSMWTPREPSWVPCEPHEILRWVSRFTTTHEFIDHFQDLNCEIIDPFLGTKLVPCEL